MKIRRFNTWHDHVEEITPGESHVSVEAAYFGECIWNAVKLASYSRQTVDREHIVYVLDAIRDAVEADQEEVLNRLKPVKIFDY